MKLEKKELIALISVIYKSEIYFKELENGCLENLKATKTLKNEILEMYEMKQANRIRVAKLKEELEEGIELSPRREKQKQEIDKLIEEQKQEDLEWEILKSKILETEIEVKDIYDDLKRLKSGNETLLKWRFLGLSEDGNLEITINNQELNDWLKINLKNEQKIIFSNIDVEKIESLFDGDLGEKRDLLTYVKKADNILFFMSAPYGFKGKETVYLYLQKEGKGSFMKCKNEDVVKNSLLNTFEEVDLSMLNKITIDNDLSRLYIIAEKEASQIDLNSINKVKINEISEQLKNLLKRND